jgi:ABC-2 type transport system permease protein
MTTTTSTASTVPPRAPSVLTSALRIFDVSLGDMLWSRRTVFMALVVGAPVVIALILRAFIALGAPLFEQTRVTGPSIFGLMIFGLYLRFIVPVLGIFYGTSLIADEVEDKTITYLFTRPIRRGAVLLGKYLAYLACTISVVLPSVMLVYLLVVPMRGSLGASFLDLVKDLAIIAVGLAVYGSLFAFVGAKFNRPLLIGLIFIFGWEQAALAIPGYMKRFSVMYYLQALVPHAIPNDGIVGLLQAVFRESPGLGTSLLWLSVIWAVCLYLAASVVERREYVLEQ